MRLVLAFLSLTSLCVFAAAAQAGEKSGNSRATTAAVPSGPPEAEIKPVADIFHGTRVIDNYRWLEKADSPATMKWVAEENAYTRAILDPLPRRDAIHQRLTELLSIGNVTAPVIPGGREAGLKLLGKIRCVLKRWKQILLPRAEGGSALESPEFRQKPR